MGSSGRPEGVPSDPDRVYASEGWDGYGDFLGVDAAAKKKAASASRWLPFAEAREKARALGLGGVEEWRAMGSSGRPEGVPAAPHRVYASKGWDGWPDFLGTAFKSFEEARAHVRRQRFYSMKEYKAWRYRPKDIPSKPE